MILVEHPVLRILCSSWIEVCISTILWKGLKITEYKERSVGRTLMRPWELILLFNQIKQDNVYSVNHPIARTVANSFFFKKDQLYLLNLVWFSAAASNIAQTICVLSIFWWNFFEMFVYPPEGNTSCVAKRIETWSRPNYWSFFMIIHCSWLESWNLQM